MKKVCIPSFERKMTVKDLLNIVQFLFSQFYNPKVYIYIYSFLFFCIWMLLPNVCYHCEIYPVLVAEVLYTEFCKNLTRLNNFFNNQSWIYDSHKPPRYFTNLCPIRHIFRKFVESDSVRSPKVLRLWHKYTKKTGITNKVEGRAE